MIKKKCPHTRCTAEELDLLGTLVINNESFNYYRCKKCKNNFKVKRTIDEQKLTQKYIDAFKIILNK